MKLRTLVYTGAIALALAVVGHLTRDYPLGEESGDRERFKYGSIGSETGGTLLHPVGGLLPPAAIFKVLPKVCTGVPTRTGPSSYAVVASYEDFGLIFEETTDPKTGTAVKRDLPVGISRRHRLGTEVVGVNCALCHGGTVRTAAGAAPIFIAGMPPQQVDVQRFFRFLFDCVQSAQFTTANVIVRIEEAERRRLSFLERLRYRMLIPRIRGRVANLDGKIGVLTSTRVTASGPGRLDTINPGKALEVGWDLNAMLASGHGSELNAPADFPAVWKLGARATPGFRMHWDGNFESTQEVGHSAALAVGAKPQTLDRPRFNVVGKYLRGLEARPYPYPIDRALAARGEEVFREHCASCHESPGAGQVTPNDVLQADSSRLDAFTPAYASSLQVALNQNYARSDFRFERIQKTGGYANVLLDGIWARAPYLHNGSVPTLRDLLEPEQCRPARFRRGSDVYDPLNVGFVSYAEPSPCSGSQPAASERAVAEASTAPGLFLFDTTLPGNRNTGHSGRQFGTELTAEAKTQLLEFLKSL